MWAPHFQQQQQMVVVVLKFVQPSCRLQQGMVALRCKLLHQKVIPASKLLLWAPLEPARPLLLKLYRQGWKLAQRFRWRSHRHAQR
jgi:hypothetical protein